MQAIGLENVRVESFEMETWVRGEERAELLTPFPQPLSITALGGSVATKPDGLEAEVALFSNLEALKAAPEGSLAGKIAYVGTRHAGHPERCLLRIQQPTAT